MPSFNVMKNAKLASCVIAVSLIGSPFIDARPALALDDSPVRQEEPSMARTKLRPDKKGVPSWWPPFIGFPPIVRPPIVRPPIGRPPGDVYQPSRPGVPEPLTLLGSAAALGAGGLLRKEYLKRDS